MGEQHTGGMIALAPADPTSMVIDGGEPANELHLTLAYLGDDVAAWTDEQRMAVLAVAQQIAAGSGPLDARVFAHTTFNADGGPDGDREPCAVYGIGESADLGPMRDAVMEMLATAGIDLPDQHSPFMPHVTAGYGATAGDLSFLGPVTFDRLRVALAADVTDLPLGAANPEEAAVTAATTTPPPAAVEVGPVVDGEIALHFPVIVLEGVPTSDGRFIDAGALTHRALPLSLLAQIQSEHGGDQAGPAVVVGRLDTLVRRPGPEVLSPRTGEPFPDGVFVWSGDGAMDATSPVAELVRRRFLRGVSVDLAAMDVEIVDEGDGPRPPDQPFMIAHAAEIAALTLCAIPAFSDAYVELAGETGPPTLVAVDDLPADLAASALPAWRSADVGDAVTAAVPMPAAPMPSADPATPDNVMLQPGDLQSCAMGDEPATMSLITGDDPNAYMPTCAMHEAEVRDVITAAGETVQSVVTIPTGGDTPPAVVAAAAARPPAAWFADPELDGPTPLHVGEDGRIAGHLACWGMSHIGMPNQRIMAPRSATNYAYYRTGAVIADDGTEIPVGSITLDTGHAGTELGHHAAAAHYDATGTVVADVAAGEDAHGIWVAGALRAHVDDATAAKLRGAALSGDWRRIGGSLELVAALAVNVPGFPIPRVRSRTASGTPMSLVAAGAVAPEAPPTSGAVVLDYDTLADAIAERLDHRRRTGDLAAAHAALVDDLDDTPAVVAALLTEVDDTPAVVAALLDELGEPQRPGRH